MGLTYNSKEAEPGTLFVCKGETFKQEYLQEAFDRGAICCVSETPYPVHPAADNASGVFEGAAQRVPAIIVKNIRKPCLFLRRSTTADLGGAEGDRCRRNQG